MNIVQIIIRAWLAFVIGLAILGACATLPDNTSRIFIIILITAITLPLIEWSYKSNLIRNSLLLSQSMLEKGVLYHVSHSSLSTNDARYCILHLRKTFRSGRNGFIINPEVEGRDYIIQFEGNDLSPGDLPRYIELDDEGMVIPAESHPHAVQN
jgi:hypothetical protein